MIPQPPFSPSAPPPISPDGGLSFNNLDPYTAKQMAALQATSLAKAGNRYAPGGVTSASYFGGLSNHQLSRPDASSTTELNNFPPSLHQTTQPQAVPNNPMNPAGQLTPQQRKKQFLHGLGNVMLGRGVPLPPQLTGIQYPSAYDASQSPWRSLDISNADVGIVRIAGKDVDLYRLWGIVLQGGGSAKLSQQNMWGQVLPHLDLPEQFLGSNGQPQSTAGILQHYFVQLLGPFEEVYRKNQRGHPGRPQQGFPMPGAGQGRPGGMPGMPGTFPPVGTLPAIHGTNNSGMMGQPMAGNMQVPDLPQAGMNIPFAGQGQMQTRHAAQQLPNGMGNNMDGTPFNTRRPDAIGISATPSLSDLNGTVDIDAEGRKRKMEEGDEVNGKRARQKTGELSDARNGSQPPVPSRTIRQPSRRKIEYVPLAREVDTMGGRELDLIQQEYTRAGQASLKDLNEWGTVDIEALTMSMRSRISTELSYALTTFTILTLMAWKHTGLSISQIPDLFEELLDLVEEVAFDGPESDASNDAPHTSIITYRHLVDSLLEKGTSPFAGLQSRQGEKERERGPGQRPGDIILTATNIIRNLSVFPENADQLTKHERALTILLRLCSLKDAADGSEPSPASTILSMNDVLQIRKDVVHILLASGSLAHLSSWNVRDVRRLFEVLASYLVDPSDAVTPFSYVRPAGIPSHLQPQLKVPGMVDAAIEAFSRVSHPDENRQILFASIPEDWLWTLFEALVHRLPVDNNDFQVILRAEWLAYLERVMMAIYSLTFLASPALKQRMKADRQLAFPKIMLRLIKKLTILAETGSRPHFAVTVRRAIESLKLVDEASDSFDVSPTTMPTLAFGMGYGEHGESREEKGMGLFSGYQEDITWGVMMQREVDDTMFNELVSLVRVQSEVS